MVCRKVRCPLGMSISHGHCAPFTEIITGAKYRLTATLVPEEGDIHMQNRTFSDASVFTLKNHLKSLLNDSLVEWQFLCWNITVVQNYRGSYWDNDFVDGGLFLNLPIYLQKIVITFQVKIIHESAKRSKVFEIFSSMIEETWTIDLNGINVTMTSAFHSDSRYVENNRHFRGKKQSFSGANESYFSIQSCDDDITARLDGGPYTRVSELLTCPQIELNASEYYTDDPYFNTIFIHHLNRSLDVFHFNTAISGKARICRDDYESITRTVLGQHHVNNIVQDNITSNREKFTIQVEVEGYLSLVCTCISLVALLLTLITYSLSLTCFSSFIYFLLSAPFNLVPTKLRTKCFVEVLGF